MADRHGAGANKGRSNVQGSTPRQGGNTTRASEQPVHENDEQSAEAQATGGVRHSRDNVRDHGDDRPAQPKHGSSRD